LLKTAGWAGKLRLPSANRGIFRLRNRLGVMTRAGGRDDQDCQTEA